MKEKPTHRIDRQTAAHCGEWHPLPPWATEEVLKRCVLYWLRSGRETDAELIAMPNE